MIKKIRVSQLRPGMYVSDFNAGWLAHPFALNSMRIDSDAAVQQVLDAGIRELFIDTARGLDLDDAPTRQEAAAATEREVETLAAATRPAAERRVTLAEELARARGSFSEATKLVRGVMEEIRLGRQPEIDALRPMVEKIAGSVFRNSNAMLTMRRLKHFDDYTFLHSVGVCTILTGFCHSLEYDTTRIHDLALGALLHDCGKMRINLGVLNKPARLSDDEFLHVKSHVMLGADLLRQLPGMSPVAFEPVEQHHERYDGSGYPRRLKGEEISEAGRMTALADVYDALTSTRVYRGALSPAEAIRRLFEWSKHHFDPQLMQAFVKSIGIYPVGTLVRLESERLGVVVEQREKSLLTPVVRVMYDARRRYYLPPEDVDLSRPLGAGGGDRIVGHEAPEQWDIDVSRFLGT